jgi:hypothetical protein
MASSHEQGVATLICREPRNHLHILTLLDLHLVHPQQGGPWCGEPRDDGMRRHRYLGDNAFRCFEAVVIGAKCEWSLNAYVVMRNYLRLEVESYPQGGNLIRRKYVNYRPDPFRAFESLPDDDWWKVAPGRLARQKLSGVCEQTSARPNAERRQREPDVETNEMAESLEEAAENARRIHREQKH